MHIEIELVPICKQQMYQIRNLPRSGIELPTGFASCSLVDEGTLVWPHEKQSNTKNFVFSGPFSASSP